MIYNGGLGDLTAARKDRLWSEAAFFIESYRAAPMGRWDGEFCLCDSFREVFGETYRMDIAHFYSYLMGSRDGNTTITRGSSITNWRSS